MTAATNRSTILCMFSGGIDSTGTLHKLLNDDQYQENQIIVHHIHLINRQNRALAEAKAVNQIISYYRTNAEREFLISESTFDSSGFAPLRSKRFPYDADVVAFLASNIAIGRKDINQIVVGRTKTDILTGGDYDSRMRRRQAIFDSLWTLEDMCAPQFSYPMLAYTKQEVWQSLPAEVKKMTFWCRVPSYKGRSPLPCGKCSTCQQVNSFINEST